MKHTTYMLAPVALIGLLSLGIYVPMHTPNVSAQESDPQMDHSSHMMNTMQEEKRNENNVPESSRPLPRGSSNSTLSTEHQNRYINLIRNTSTRMEGAIARLKNVAGRIETRMNKLESEGVPVEEARTSLTKAREILDGAALALAPLAQEGEQGITSTSPKTAFRDTKKKYLAVRDTILEAFVLLRETVSTLKDSSAETAFGRTQVGGALGEEVGPRTHE